MGMVTSKWGQLPFFLLPWQLQAWLLRRVRMGKWGRGLASCHLSKPGLVQSFLTVGLKMAHCCSQRPYGRDSF